MQLDLKVTNVFSRNLDGFHDPKYRFFFNQGGTGSSKSYSIAQLIAYLSLTELNNADITVVRKTLVACRKTSMKDFETIIKNMDIYSEGRHNKTDHEYTIGNNNIAFIGIDIPQKIRSRKHNILWLNETNELTLEDYMQLMLRTSGKIFIDFNPSDEFHWLYEKVLPRKDCLFIQSTYKDNPFLEPAKIEEIELLEEMDKNYWRVYGLGERGVSEHIIYTNYEIVEQLPEKIDDTIYGLDFGFNNPSCLTEINYCDTDIYIRELLYESKLTNSLLIGKLESLKINPNSYIYCDNAEPARIEEISLAGFNTMPADKSVSDGIDFCKSRKLKILECSINGIKELRSYKWKTNKNGDILDEPLKFNDHFCDSFRYALYTNRQVLQPTFRGLGQKEKSK